MSRRDRILAARLRAASRRAPRFRAPPRAPLLPAPLSRRCLRSAPRRSALLLRCAASPRTRVAAVLCSAAARTTQRARHRATTHHCTAATAFAAPAPPAPLRLPTAAPPIVSQMKRDRHTKPKSGMELFERIKPGIDFFVVADFMRYAGLFMKSKAATELLSDLEKLHGDQHAQDGYFGPLGASYNKWAGSAPARFMRTASRTARPTSARRRQSSVLRRRPAAPMANR